MSPSGIGRAVERVQLLLRSRPLRPLYRASRRGYHLARYALRIPHEPDWAAFRRFPPGDGILLDVGASSGTSAMSFRVFDRTTPILSIEPNAVLEPELRFLRRVLPRFDFRICAAGEENGEMTLYVPVYRGVPITAESSLIRAHVEDSTYLRELLGDRVDSGDFEIVEHRVPLRRLDDLGVTPAYLKIDVQGAEEQVLRGLTETIERHRPVVLIERGDNFGAVADFLGARGYEPRLYDAEGDRLVPFAPDAPNVNAFFVPTRPARDPAG